jgi:hypothetical protein
VPRPAKSLLGQQAQRTWPPFFDGRYRMQIVMALSRWGPMRLNEIAALTGESARATSHWNRATRHLERLRVIVRHKRHPTHLVVGLDRAHPAHREIRWFGEKLYELYLAPSAPRTPAKRRRPLPAGVPPDPDALDLHVLGAGGQIRLLHLIVETRSSPGYVLVRGLGLHLNAYKRLRAWSEYGVVLLRFARRKVNRRHFAVHLDRRWPAHPALYALLKRLNTWMPEYAQIAQAYRAERALNHHSVRWKHRQAKIRRTFGRLRRRYAARTRENEGYGA